MFVKRSLHVRYKQKDGYLGINQHELESVRDCVIIAFKRSVSSVMDRNIQPSVS